MKQIQLGGRLGSKIKGYVWVDDEDYDQLNQLNWYMNSDGYAYRTLYNKGVQKNIPMHRVITNAPEGKDVDHIDRNKLNNQKSNLRICGRSLNIFNTEPHRKNLSSGIRGVSYSKLKMKWRVRLTLNKKYIINKFVDSKEEAGKIYKEAVEKMLEDVRNGVIAA
jgi:hypothetical protein